MSPLKWSVLLVWSLKAAILENFKICVNVSGFRSSILVRSLKNACSSHLFWAFVLEQYYFYFFHVIILPLLAKKKYGGKSSYLYAVCLISVHMSIFFMLCALMSYFICTLLRTPPNMFTLTFILKNIFTFYCFRVLTVLCFVFFFCCLFFFVSAASSSVSGNFFPSISFLVRQPELRLFQLLLLFPSLTSYASLCDPLSHRGCSIKFC